MTGRSAGNWEQVSFAAKRTAAQISGIDLAETLANSPRLATSPRLANYPRPAEYPKIEFFRQLAETRGISPKLYDLPKLANAPRLAKSRCVVDSRLRKLAVANLRFWFPTEMSLEPRPGSQNPAPGKKMGCRENSART